MPDLDNFPAVARSAWQTDDHKTTFCMPTASVIHGFIYNQNIFDELKLQPPKTMAEFHAVLEAIKKDGRYTPLAIAILSEFVQQIPRDLREAARCDGVSEYRIFWSLILPLLRPAVATVAVFTMVLVRPRVAIGRAIVRDPDLFLSNCITSCATCSSRRSSGRRR